MLHIKYTVKANVNRNKQQVEKLLLINCTLIAFSAHGKRSGSRDTPFRDDPATKDIVIPKWFLSKMMQDPMDLHYMHNREQEPSFKQHPEQLFSGNDADADAFKAYVITLS